MLVISTAPSASRLTGWLAPRWPWCILIVLRADREAEQLVAEADAEQRLAGLQQLPDHRHRVFAGRGRIAGAVGEEDAVGLVRHDLVEARGGGHHGDPRAGVGEVAEDVVLGAVVDRDDMRPALVLARLGIALAAAPSGRLPSGYICAAGHVLGEVHALRAPARRAPWRAARRRRTCPRDCARSPRWARRRCGSCGSARGCRRRPGRSGRWPSASRRNPALDAEVARAR